MSYELEFKATALKEWQKLDHTIREQFKKILTKRLETPRVSSAQLSSLPDCYKIKLRNQGYRLVYVVEDDVLVVIVLAIGKRERLAAYEYALKRLITKRVG